MTVALVFGEKKGFFSSSFLNFVIGHLLLKYNEYILLAFAL